MKKAFTIVELIIYMGIMAVLLTVITSIFLSVLDVQLQSEATTSVQSDGRYILSRLVYDIHRAANITTPASAGQTATSLVTDVASYASVGDNLLINGTDNLNSYATKLANFSVTRLGNPSGSHTLTVSFTLTDQTETKDYQISVGLR